MFWGRGDLSQLKIIFPKKEGHSIEGVQHKTKQIVKCLQPICHEKCRRH